MQNRSESGKQRDRRAEFAGYAERIKESVSIGDVLTLNGIQVNRHGFAVCPLHGDRDASLKVYENGRGWVCYGCHKGGDVINLAMALYGIGFQESVRRLNDEFHVGIDIDAEPNLRDIFFAAAKLGKIKAERKRQQEERASLESAYWRAFDKWLDLDRDVLRLEESFDRVKDSFPDAFCKAITDRAEAYEELMILEERRLRKDA